VLRILHTADVHLGARHTDLGERAAAQRERQFAAFVATVDLAIAEQVDLFLVAGDLFDSNTQPRRSVERVAQQLKRLADARIRSVIIPGTHDVYDDASIYRAYDLAALAGQPPGGEYVTVLTPERPEVVFPVLDTVVFGRVFPAKRAPHSPLAGFTAAAHPAHWRIGLIHGSLLVPGRTEHDEVVFSQEEVAASGLDYLALGHWHSVFRGRAGSTTFAYAGAPEPVAIDQDQAGFVLLVGLDDTGGERRVTVEERRVGRTRFETLDIHVETLASQPDLVQRLAERADPDLVLDVRLVGFRPDQLDLEVDEVMAQLADRFFRLRVRDQSIPPLSEGTLPSAETVLGAFIRNLEGRIAELEAAGQQPEAEELRDALRVGRLLLTGHEVTL
jgi:DNA repair exonuclease SbcCD nuclease subunit